MTAFKTAYVHIGMHKTGTTSIQQTLARHRAMLRESYGVVYPAVSSNHSIPLFSLFCDAPAEYSGNIIAGATSKEDIATRNQDFADRLKADLDAGGETLVLSGEDLGLLTRPGVHRLKKWLSGHAESIRILAYVREPVAWATSHAQQQVRQGKVLETLLQGALVPRFRRRLTPWMVAFGKENVSVSDFDVARAGPAGLVGHFTDQLGLPESVHETLVQKRSNESLSAEAVTLMSALNALKPAFVDNRASADRAAKIDPIFARIKGARFRLPAEAIARTEAMSAAEVAWLGETFGLSFAAPPRRGDEEPGLFSSEATQQSLAMLIWELAGAAAGAGDAAEDRPANRHKLTGRPVHVLPRQSKG
jgi:hypothetical protein